MSLRPQDLPDAASPADPIAVQLATSPALDDVESAAVARALHREALGPGEPAGRSSAWWLAGLLQSRDRTP